MVTNPIAVSIDDDAQTVPDSLTKETDAARNVVRGVVTLVVWPGLGTLYTVASDQGVV